MALTEISTKEDLHTYLYAAMQLEHATIPPYLTAMYTMKPGSNLEAYNVIRVIVVEEMLHLTLAANLLNATGGKPDMTKKGFVPSFPTYLPDGEQDFEVSIQSFSKKSIHNFLDIERPAKPHSASNNSEDTPRFLKMEAIASPSRRIIPHQINAQGEAFHFYSIGEFYAYIGESLEKLTAEMGESTLFNGDKSRQITPEYYYSGGGEIIPVYDLASAMEAIRTISEQGEGFDGGIYDHEGELAHFYRFKQLEHERYYMQGDLPDRPSGEPLAVDWDAVYPIIANPKMEDYPDESSLSVANMQFNAFYKKFLSDITKAFNGSPADLIPAIGNMFIIKEMAYALIHNPVPGKEGLFGAPTFEVDKVPAAIPSLNTADSEQT